MIDDFLKYLKKLIPIFDNFFLWQLDEFGGQLLDYVKYITV